MEIFQEKKKSKKICQLSNIIAVAINIVIS